PPQPAIRHSARRPTAAHSAAATRQRWAARSAERLLPAKVTGSSRPEAEVVCADSDTRGAVVAAGVDRLGAVHASQGVSVRVLQELAGHKHIGTTQRYIDVNDDMKRSALMLI